MTGAEYGSFDRIRRGGFSGWVRREFPGDPEPLLGASASAGAQICKDRPKILAFVLGTYFVKIYRHPSWWRRLRSNFKLPRPERALRGAARLEAAGIPTPQVLAALRERRGALVMRDALVTARLEAESVTADKFLPELEAGARRELAQALCALLGAMHRAGFVHGDVSLRNLYRDNGGCWGVFDLDGCRLYCGEVPPEWRVRELARLATSFDRTVPGHGIAHADFIEFYREAGGAAVPPEALASHAARLMRHKAHHV